MRGTSAAPEPMASRLRFYDDAQLEQLGRAAGFTSVSVVQRDLEGYARGAGVRCAGDLQLDPALPLVERLIGQYAEAQPVPLELERAVLVAHRNAGEPDALDHEYLLCMVSYVAAACPR